MGGIATYAPKLAIVLVIVSLANIALPLTNGFIGEFLMFSGLFQYNPWFAAVAGIAIILAAVYMLRMLQKVIFGEANAQTSSITDLKAGELLAIGIVIAVIFVLGVYPKPLLELVNGTSTLLLNALI